MNKEEIKSIKSKGNKTRKRKIDLVEHYHDDVQVEKEVSETLSCFAKLKSEEPTKVLSLCCGNLVAADQFHNFFPHPESKLTGVDKKFYKLAQQYVDQRFFTFIEADLFSPISSELSLALQEAEVWIAIHACRNLADQIVSLFEHFAKPKTTLLLVPCCVLKRKFYLKKLGNSMYKKFRQEAKEKSYQKGLKKRKFYVTAASSLMRNYLLSQSPFYQKTETLEDMKSEYNTALYFQK